MLCNFSKKQWVSTYIFYLNRKHSRKHLKPNTKIDRVTAIKTNINANNMQMAAVAALERSTAWVNSQRSTAYCACSSYVLVPCKNFARDNKTEASLIAIKKGILTLK